MIEDLCRNFEIDGILWGLERQGGRSRPSRRTYDPACFCDFCVDAGSQLGIDVARARGGYSHLVTYFADIVGGGEPRDGYFVSFLRILLRFPEILQWEKMWADAHKAFAKDIYGIIKFLDEDREMGLGVWYRITTTNPYLRAQYDYEEFIGACDWIKQS